MKIEISDKQYLKMIKIYKLSRAKSKNEFYYLELQKEKLSYYSNFDIDE